MTSLYRVIINHKLLFFIILFAAFLRFIGTNPGYNLFHSDEGISYSAAASMIKNGNLDPLRYDYPAVVPLINYIFFKLIFVPLNWVWYYITHFPQLLDGVISINPTELEQKRVFQLFVVGERERNALFWGRYVTALFSLGNVILVYLLTKKLFGNGPGLIAAAILAFNFRHVLNAHIGLPDIYSSFFLLFTIYMTAKLWENPTRMNYLLAGIIAGLSFSTKYHVYGFLPLILVHLFVNLKKGFLSLSIFKLLLAFVSSAVIFIILNPYFFIHFEVAQDILSYVTKKYAFGVNRINLYPIWYLYSIDMGPLLFAFSLFGIIACLVKDFKKSTLLLFPLTLFAYIFLYYSNGGFYVRNLITITPLLIIFAAYFFHILFLFIKKQTNNRVAFTIFVTIFIALIFIPAKNALINSYFYTKAWNYDQLREWERINLPAGSIVASHPFDPLDVQNVKRTGFELGGNYSLAEHKEAGAQYILINLDWAGNDFYSWMHCVVCNKPLEKMRNTYTGLAAEEIFSYQIYSAIKPWQAPDANLVLAKIPDWPDVKMREISKYPSIPESLIDVGAGKLYKVEGFIKHENPLSESQREGFLRVDFYPEGYDLEKVGISSALSPRYWGSGDWKKVEIITRAPDNAKHMRIKFQIYSQSSKFDLKDISVFESEDIIEDITKKPPYNIVPIEFDLLYPNSHGNL